MEYKDSGGSFSSYHNMKTLSGVDSNEFTRLCNVINFNIQKISQNVSSMQIMVNQLGTQQDSEKLRDNLHQSQRYCNQLAKDTDSYMKNLQRFPPPPLLSEQRQRNLQKERLMNEFSLALNNFQAIQRRAAEKEKASIARARAHSGLGGVSIPDLNKTQLVDDDMKSDEVLLHGNNQRIVIQMEEDVDVNTLREREQAITKLESDIVAVNQIFKDLAVMVHEQGEIVDSIESNVESATIHVEEGANKISQAKDYQSKARKKKFLCIIITIVVLAIIGLILGLVYGGKS